MEYEGVLRFLLRFFAVIGAYSLLNYLIVSFHSLGGYLCEFFNTRRKPFTKRYGQWAVITGATDGIGKQYALNLAKRGMSVFLLSRTESRLIDTAREIREKYSVEVQWLAVDFSEGYKIYEVIQHTLAGLDIGILVNNVGDAHDHPLHFEKLTRQEIQRNITINMGAVALMTHMLVPDMKRRRRGMIVNMSSTAGLWHFPFVALYSASKAFITRFSLALREELRGSGVACQLVQPSFILTKLNAEWDSVWWWHLMVSDVRTFSRAAVSTIGNTQITGGHWWHELQIGFMQLFPSWFFSKFLYYLAKPHLKRQDQNPVEGKSNEGFSGENSRTI